MNCYKFILILVGLFFAFRGLTSLEAEPIVLEDLQGRTMEVTVLRQDGETIVIERVDNGKVYAISPDSLNENSKISLLNVVKNLKPIYPPIEADVVIGTRRKEHNGSSYMKRMEVTAKVTLKNKKVNVDCPPCKGELILIGQSQSSAEDFQVLSSQTFQVTPSREGAVFLAKPFSTIYDSDNKGYGNIGGFKYEGYLLIVRDLEGKVLFTKTVYAKIKKAMQLDVSFVDEFSKLPKGTTLSESMKRR